MTEEKLKKIKEEYPEYTKKTRSSCKIQIGKKYGKCTVLYRTFSNTRHPKWVCECECGNITTKFSTNLLQTPQFCSCGCVYARKAKDNLRIKHEGEEYNGIKIISYVGLDKNHHQKYKCKCPKCGNEFIGNFREIKNGQDNCGCTRTKSRNENVIFRLLTILNVSFIKEYTFNDLKIQNKLRFDFYVNNNYIIEFDGPQHFFLSDKISWDTEEKFINRHKNDLLKNKYCFDNNIPLIRIPYDADYTIDDLKLETTRFLLTPQNEKEYYESRR